MILLHFQLNEATTKNRRFIEVDLHNGHPTACSYITAIFWVFRMDSECDSPVMHGTLKKIQFCSLKKKKGTILG